MDPTADPASPPAPAGVRTAPSTAVSTAVSTAPTAEPAPVRDPRLVVPLVLLDPGLEPPGYAHDGDAGADLRTAVDVELGPGERSTVPTGVAIALPPGYAAFVHPRSGLAARFGLTVVNAPGTVDAGYRGEISVTLLNTDSARAVRLSRGDRIAQLVVQRVEVVRFVAVDELPGSARGTGGFGSTGGFWDAPEAPAVPGAGATDVHVTAPAVEEE